MYNYSLFPNGHLIERENSTGMITYQIRRINGSFLFTGRNSHYHNTRFYMKVESGGSSHVYNTREGVNGFGFRVFLPTGNPLLSS